MSQNSEVFMSECKTCDGKGSRWDGCCSFDKCKSCNGTGMVPNQQAVCNHLWVQGTAKFDDKTVKLDAHCITCGAKKDQQAERREACPYAGKGGYCDLADNYIATLQKQNAELRGVAIKASKLQQDMDAFYKAQDAEIASGKGLSDWPRLVWESIIEDITEDAKQALKGGGND